MMYTFYMIKQQLPTIFSSIDENITVFNKIFVHRRKKSKDTKIDSLLFLSYPFRQDQGAYHQERIIEDDAPKHGGKDGYRGIGQEIGIIKAEHQLRHAASTRRRTQDGNHPHHPLPAPRDQHVALTMEGYENGNHNGESR